MITIKNPHADLFIPDQTAEAEAIRRTTHLAVAAHPDDLEILAFDGILRCRVQPDRWFCGVVVTDGAGSPRASEYAGCSDEQMRQIRRQEQEEAARIGRYGALIQLGYASSEAKDPGSRVIVEDLASLIAAARPAVLYTHNPADKHETHVAVCLKVIQAIRRLPLAERPQKLYGGEIWRSLDWLDGDEKTLLDVSAGADLEQKLLGVFRSQIAGGKRYDRAVAGRRAANATFSQSHAVDRMTAADLALDLTPLITDDELSIVDFVDQLIQRFRDQTRQTIQQLL
jgi:LmbE family N-acetylglucosaminyl deacetylase